MIFRQEEFYFRLLRYVVFKIHEEISIFILFIYCRNCVAFSLSSLSYLAFAVLFPFYMFFKVERDLRVFRRSLGGTKNLMKISFLIHSKDTIFEKKKKKLHILGEKAFICLISKSIERLI